MTVIEVYHNGKTVNVKVKTKFWDDGGHKYAQMHQLGFKFHSRLREYTKTYFDPEYTHDRYNADLESINEVFKGRIVLRRFKMVEESITE